MKSSYRITLLAAGLSAAMLIGFGCDSGTQQSDAPDSAASPQAAGKESDAREPDVIPAERYPEQIAEDAVAAIPEIFPEEIPIYPGAVPAQGRGNVVDGVPMSTVQLMSLDAADDVYEYYSGKLTEDGWTIEDREGFAEKKAISAYRGDCKASMIVVPTGDGGSDIYIFSEC